MIDGYATLLAAVIAQALDDVKAENMHAEYALLFLLSEALADLLEMLGIDPQHWRAICDEALAVV